MELNLIIPAYNRPSALKRLLASISDHAAENIMHLTITCDGGASTDVLDFCAALKWPFGKLEIVTHDHNMGVDRHNIWCIEQAISKGHVIVLEDDLIVGPRFAEYVKYNAGSMEAQEEVAALALYRYTFRESGHLPFQLIPNDEFIYYQQRSCSKGCYYSAEMAEDYLRFLEAFDGDYSAYHLPVNVKKWGDEVWEKSFYCYLISTGRYVAFPRYSLTTDFADHGVHMDTEAERYVHQVPLFQGKRFSSQPLLNSINVYDAFYEMKVAVVKRLNPELASYDLSMDLHGDKDRKYIESKYLLSSHRCGHVMRSWADHMKPEVVNVLMNNEGEGYSLGHRSDFKDRSSHQRLRKQFLYYFPDTRLVSLLRMKWQEVLSRFIS